MRVSIKNAGCNKRNFAQDELEDCIGNMSDFLVQGDAEVVVKKIADECGYSVIDVMVKSDEDLIGTPVFYKTEDGMTYFNRELSWTEPIKSNPDTTYLVLFHVDEVEDSTVMKLKSFVDRKDYDGMVCENAFVGVLCADKERKFSCEPLLSLLNNIVWD